MTFLGGREYGFGAMAGTWGMEECFFFVEKILVTIRLPGEGKEHG
jgi:hypothetical protein